MNAAEVVEFTALARQKPMNDVIDRGDSPIQQFYCGATVFVTGGSGFLGKQLIEKLFRSCQIKKLFVLLRPRKGKTIQERLEEMLKDPAYDMVREKQPHFADKIVPVNGDVAEIMLGVSEKDWIMLTREVDTIFHVAATVRFDAPLCNATMTNVRGTREALALARQCTNLRIFVHVSTAFCHATHKRVGQELKEQFYQSPISPDALIQLVENVEEAKLNNITPALTRDWPNTYTFTKALAEELIRTADDLPLCVVRPPVVIASYTEPVPGWVDMSCVFSSSGVSGLSQALLGASLGLIHVMYVDKYINVHLEPVDLVNNAIIAAGWDSTHRRDNGDCKVVVYNVINEESHIDFDYVDGVLQKHCTKYYSPKAVWYCFNFLTKNEFVYWVLKWVFHFIPAYVLDAVFTVIPVKPKEIPPLVKIYSKIDKLSTKHRYFLLNNWIFKDDNVKAMIGRMGEADKAIFNCDLCSVDKTELIKVWTLGLRKYISKDGLEGCEEGCRKQKIFRVAHYVFMIVYFYVFWSIFSTFFNVVKNILA